MNFKVEYVNKLKIVITTFLIILISLGAYLFKDVFRGFENKFLDARSYLSTDGGLFSYKFDSADKNIVILSIDDLTQYEAAHSAELNLTRWPWSRVVWAKLINFIERQKPKLLIVDLNFSNYEDLSRNYTSPDMVLADALGYYRNIILATALKTPFIETEKNESASFQDNFENPYNPASDSLNVNAKDTDVDKNITFYSHAPIPNIFTNSTTMGVTNLVTSKNHDENIRFSQPIYKLIKGNREYYLPSIGLAAMMKYYGLEQSGEPIIIDNGNLKISGHNIRINENGQVPINWHAHGAVYTDIPIISILLSMVRGSDTFEYKNTDYPLSFFKDKIVIIAQTQLNTETHNTPIAKQLPDAQIKATIIDNYINDTNATNSFRRPFIKNIKPYKGTVLTVLFCLAIIFAMLVATNMPLAFLNGSLITTAYVLLSIFLYCHPKYRVALDMAMPLYFIISTFLISFTLKAHHEYKKKRKIQKIFGNLVSQNVLKQLVTKPHRLNLKSSVQNVTVMSCNISNNLEISDELSPEKYVELINNVFNAIEKIIFKYNGTINRFVGNTVLVYWGYPIHSRKDPENAIKAAIEISQKIDEFNASVNNITFDEYDERNFIEENPGKYFFSVKIAINTGDAIIGQIGSNNVSDFTVLGETVDIIERIENIGNEFGKSIIISQSTLDKTDSKVPTEYIGQVRLKNSTTKIKLHELQFPDRKKHTNRDFQQ